MEYAQYFNLLCTSFKITLWNLKQALSCSCNGFSDYRNKPL